MISKSDKNGERVVRHKRVRAKVSGTAQKPRLCVYRSLSNIYVQVINDENGTTIASASTLDSEVASLCKGKSKTEQAKIVGQTVAKRAMAKKVKEVVFDRGGYIYTGRVASVADGARDAGLKF